MAIFVLPDCKDSRILFNLAMMILLPNFVKPSCDDCQSLSNPFSNDCHMYSISHWMNFQPPTTSAGWQNLKKLQQHEPIYTTTWTTSQVTTTWTTIEQMKLSVSVVSSYISRYRKDLDILLYVQCEQTYIVKMFNVILKRTIYISTLWTLHWYIVILQ